MADRCSTRARLKRRRESLGEMCRAWRERERKEEREREKERELTRTLKNLCVLYI